MKLSRKNHILIAGSLALCAPSLAFADTPELFTSGHGDIAVEFDEAANELDVHWHFEGAMVGGKMVGEEHEHEEGEEHEHEEGEAHEHDEGAERHIEDVIVATGKTFTRPSGSSFDLLGVDVGQEVYYLPQAGDEADRLEVPFLGWAFEAPDGIFRNNAITLTLISASSTQSSDPAFALWSTSGFSPVFAISTADGISSDDKITLENHEHFSMGLGLAGQPGDVSLEFEARAEKLSGEVLTKRFSVAAKTCDGACRVRTAPAPAIGALGPIGLLLGLGGLFVGRRRNKNA